MSKEIKGSQNQQRRYRSFQVLIIINAILFLLSIPSDLPFFIGNSVAIINFLLTAFIAIKLYRANIIGVALYFFIIAVYYNPLLFLSNNIPSPSALDVMVASSFFIIALCWNYILDPKK